MQSFIVELQTAKEPLEWLGSCWSLRVSQREREADYSWETVCTLPATQCLWLKIALSLFWIGSLLSKGCLLLFYFFYYYSFARSFCTELPHRYALAKNPASHSAWIPPNQVKKSFNRFNFLQHHLGGFWSFSASDCTWWHTIGFL